MKRKALLTLDRKETNFLISFACGALSGSLAAFLTTPFDVVKTHRQVTLGEVPNGSPTTSNQSLRRYEMAENQCCKTCAPKSGGPQIKSKFTFALMKEIREKKGNRALFAGIICRCLRNLADHVSLRFNIKCRKTGYKSIAAKRLTGLTARVIKVSLACATMIGSYEYFKISFAKMNNIHADLEASKRQQR
ncbi:unnamed protein product [Gongylonema pulchrum]|uniref:Mitochondrial carrier protein n=1 Tax=Gongylonema pulchrum TaxID=637853 RepID=A0A3P7Q1F7_9BILA|nr:unnamed protein product [Gongylonema pulchrum]